MFERLSPRVERGAALLDSEWPGWENEIDRERLNLYNGRYCVLGQLYGTYGAGLQALDGAAARKPERFGFVEWPNRLGYRELTRQWRLALARRRGEA